MYKKNASQYKLEKFGGEAKDLTLIDLYLWFDGEELSGHIWEDEAKPNYEEKSKKLLQL